jgi:hypothetical protein
LEAIEDLNINKTIRDKAIPLDDKDAKPEISVTLKLQKEDLAELKEKISIDSAVEEIEIEVIKKYPNVYEIRTESLDKINPAKQNIPKIRNVIAGIISTVKDKLQNFPITGGSIENPPQLLNELSAYQLQFPPDVNEDEKRSIEEQINELKNLFKGMKEANDFEVEFIEILKQYFIPNFILFITFDDILPSQKSIAEASAIPIIKDLSLISGVDFNIIQPSTDPREREKHRERVNLKFSEEYKEFWTQDSSNLWISWDSNNVYFWIKEGNEYYDPEMRSKGRQWHLSFYVRVTARSFEGKNNIILIDEPGLFLHAKAQKDILQKLEQCAERTQIIYTTHSPYLIPSENLNRVRLVVKYDGIGTKVEKLTAKADKETLTPILTAIGEDFCGGIRVDKRNSIVLEGFSDYLWLTSFKKLLSVAEELNFVPSVGAGTVPYVGSILFGWGLDPIFILDNDNNGREAKQKLVEQLSIDESKIILLPQNKEGRIEDLFSEEDFKKYVRVSESNKKSKTLIATQFHQKVEAGEITISNLCEETSENFKNVFIVLKELIRRI